VPPSAEKAKKPPEPVPDQQPPFFYFGLPRPNEVEIVRDRPAVRDQQPPIVTEVLNERIEINIHSRLGGSFFAPNETLVDQLSLPAGQGLVLHYILLDSPAAKAGLKNNDILLQVGGTKVPNSPNEFEGLLNGFKAGEAIDAVVIRKGKRETVNGLILPEVPADNQSRSWRIWDSRPSISSPKVETESKIPR